MSERKRASGRPGLWTALALQGLVLWAVPASAQSVNVEFGMMNFGPVVKEEVDNFVRFGSNDGMAHYFALTLQNGETPWYARLTLAPTQVHVWSTEQTTHPSVGSGSDPSRSRFHYRPVGSARDSFIWYEVTGGRTFERGPFDARLGAGIISLTQTDHGFWGAAVGVAPKVEGAAGVSWRALSLTGQLSVGRLGTPMGRWIVLEHAAGGERPQSGERRARTLIPVSLGMRISL